MRKILSLVAIIFLLLTNSLEAQEFIFTKKHEVALHYNPLINISVLTGKDKSHILEARYLYYPKSYFGIGFGINYTFFETGESNQNGYKYNIIYSGIHARTMASKKVRLKPFCDLFSGLKYTNGIRNKNLPTQEWFNKYFFSYYIAPGIKYHLIGNL